MELPAELTTRKPRGSRLSELPTLNLYWSPALAAGTSADQYPFQEPPGVSFARAVAPHPLKLPRTPTDEALGAQVRNVTPVPPESA